MLFHMVSLMCTVVPCAHIIQTEGPFLAPADTAIEPINAPKNLPVYPSVVGDRNATIEKDLNADQKKGRAIIQNSKTQLLLPPQDQPTQDADEASLLQNQNPVVSIKDGRLRGFLMNTINSRTIAVFQGIPYAKPPVGSLRFQAPRKNLPWVGIKDAIDPSPPCIQTDYMQQYKVHGNESCLFLNVYTPKLPKASFSQSKKLLPVMVFIHGGGFFFGSSQLYGPSYLLDEDIVLVSMTYRLGALGFLSTGDDASPGNNGLKDQQLALRWVQENIAAFGGDPNSVTIFGESAGASSVQFHIVSPLSRGLFHRGISQSGCATCFWSIDERAPETAQKFGALLNCTGSSSEMISCLRTKDAAQLAATHLYFLEWLMYPVVVFGPVVEHKHSGAFLSEQPEEVYRKKEAAEVPWISGYNKDEGAINIAVLFLDNNTLPQLNNEWEKYGPLFLEMRNSTGNFDEAVKKVRMHYLGESDIAFPTRQASIDMFGDRYSIVCGLKAMRYHSLYTGQPVFAYYLSYNGKYSIVQLLGQSSRDWGVSHLNDLVYLFNNTDYYPELKLEDEEYQMSKIMTALWANFAHYGQPLLSVNKEPKNIWEPIEKSTNLSSPLKFLDLSLDPKMIEDPFAERDKFWRDLNLVD